MPSLAAYVAHDDRDWQHQCSGQESQRAQQEEDRLVTSTEPSLHMKLLNTCHTHETDHVQKVEWSKGTVTHEVCIVYTTYMHSSVFKWPFASTLASIHTCMHNGSSAPIYTKMDQRIMHNKLYMCTSFLQTAQT